MLPNARKEGALALCQRAGIQSKGCGYAHEPRRDCGGDRRQPWHRL
jgi:hypothetical protein